MQVLELGGQGVTVDERFGLFLTFKLFMTKATCSRCKRRGHWQQDCFVGRIRLDEFFDAQGFKDARRDFAALQPKDPKQELRK